MNTILNAKSEFIEIFPISIDRLNSKTIYTRKSDYDKIDAFDSLSDAQKNVVNSSPTLTLDSITDPLKPFYDEVSTSGSSRYHNGRALTEQNLSNIICKLTNKPGYVIDSGSDYIEFMLKGHYFKLSDPGLLGKTNLYVGVNFTNTSNNNFDQLDGYDINEGSTDIFKEVDFSEDELYTSKPSDSYEGIIYDIVLPLKLEGIVPTSSKFRFNGNSIENINGGTV